MLKIKEFFKKIKWWYVLAGIAVLIVIVIVVRKVRSNIAASKTETF